MTTTHSTHWAQALALKNNSKYVSSVDFKGKLLREWRGAASAVMDAQTGTEGFTGWYVQMWVWRECCPLYLTEGLLFLLFALFVIDKVTFCFC